MGLFKKIKTKLSYQYRLLFKPDQFVTYRNFVKKGNKAKGKNPKAAYENFKQAYALNPNDHKSAVQMIHAMRKLQDAKDVTKELMQLKERFPKVAQIWRELGKQYLKGSPSKACTYWGRAYDMEPEHLNTGLVFARMLIQAKEEKRALEVINELLEVHPEDAKLLRLAEIVYFKNGRIYGNDAELVKLLWKDPSDWQIKQIMGDKLVNRLMNGLQERDSENKKRSISFEDRPEFLADPKGYFAPVKDNVLYQTLETIREESRERKQKQKKSQTVKKKVLVVSDHNWNFTEEMIAAMVGDADIELRTLEFTDRGTAFNTEIRVLMGNIISDKLLGQENSIRYENGLYHQELVDWADTIFIEWCNYPAVWLSHFAPPEKEIIVRLHSYEAFSFWPHLVNWGNVNRLVFIAPQINKFMLDLIDVQPYGTAVTVLPNFNRLENYQLPKEEGVGKTIGMIGYNNANKNPLMALELLKELRDGNGDWRLVLVGHAFPDESENEFEENYKRSFFGYLKEHGLANRVMFHEFTLDLPAVIRKMGWIVSCSGREGTHESVIQAMAGGTVPLVRNWPIFAEYGGAEGIYGGDFTFDTAKEMADYVRVNSAAVKMKEASERARQYAFKHFDLPEVYAQLKDVL